MQRDIRANTKAPDKHYERKIDNIHTAWPELESADHVGT